MTSSSYLKNLALPLATLVLQHLALAAAVPGLLGLRLGGLIAFTAAAAWLPASGWFLSQWKVSGFVGWERPAFAVVMALPLLLLLLRTPLPKSPHS